MDDIDAALEFLRRGAIAAAGRIDPSITAQVEADQAEIDSHEERLLAQRRPTPPPPPRPKTAEQVDAEKFEREVQTRVRAALKDLEAERQAATEE